MAIYSYVITHDTGFAPNPFGGSCTLATCKPVIRRTARVGDWIIGTGSARGVGNLMLVYAMRISEILRLEAYAAERRFQSKRPKLSGEPWKHLGDNIYYLDERGEWRQRRSQHEKHHMDHDLSGKNVLIAEEFYYFGEDAVPLPSELLPLVKRGPGHRRCTDPQLENSLVSWLRGSFDPGIHGDPYDKRETEHVSTCRQPRRSIC